MARIVPRAMAERRKEEIVLTGDSLSSVRGKAAAGHGGHAAGTAATAAEVFPGEGGKGTGKRPDRQKRSGLFLLHGSRWRKVAHAGYFFTSV